MSVSFLHVCSRGTHREIGRAIGEAAASQIAIAVSFYKEHFAHMAGISFEEAESRAIEYLPHARRYLPQYVDELRGMAEGSHLPFVELLVLNCAEEFTCAADADDTESPNRGTVGERGCTVAGVVRADRHVVGQNMDWYVVDVDTNVLFDLTMVDGTRILTIGSVPYLPMAGMNSHGVAYGGNAVYSNDNRVGVPNAFVRRWALEAATLEEAYARVCMPGRARGSNHFLGDTAGRLWNLEASSSRASRVESSTWLAHTNHYVTPVMASYESYYGEESRSRLASAEAALARGYESTEDPVELLASLLRSHDESSGGSGAICVHPDMSSRVADRGTTAASMVMDLDQGRLLACAGPPCENAYQEFVL
jgi:isopenicillin-N N-acyltransferase-like protein